MQSEHWYIVTYDITHPRRLQKIHRYLRTEGYPLQESVFLWAGTLEALEKLRGELSRRMRKSEDDVRILPVDSRALLRFWGLPPFEQGIMNNDLPAYCNHELGNGFGDDEKSGRYDASS